MSLTKEAIQHLEKSPLLDALNAELDKFTTAEPIVALPHDISLQNLEQYMPNRTDYRYNFRTKSIPDFVEYCKEFDDEGAKCFIDSDHMTAESVLDLGTKDAPLHQRHSANIKLDKTAAFLKILSLNGNPLSQKDAANFVDDWSDEIAVWASNGDPITNIMASNRFSEITIEQVRDSDSRVSDFGESMTKMEKIEAKNQELIPAFIDFTCVPYQGLAPRKFQLRVSILTGGDRPKVSLRIIKLEAHEEDMANEFKELLVDKFSDSELKTLIGS